MAQLSTDTLAYTQIISKVQDFLIKYFKNENNETLDFDKEYKKLLLEIEKSIGIPMTKIDFFNKGEIPSSSKLNLFTKNLSTDINIIINQLDSLVANYVNSFNQISNLIESEKNFVSRIKSKINVLELYSNSSVNNIVYMSDFFDNLDFVDVSKIRTGFLPEINEGFASLARKNLKKLNKSINIVNQNYNNEQQKNITFVDVSNGLPGSNHLYYDDPQNNNPFLFERDSTLLKSNKLAMVDESPATYFEYEALNVVDSDLRPEYEFQYIVNKQTSQYAKWSDFDLNNSLKLSVEILTQNSKGNDINYISIVPFFGYDNVDLIKNIKVNSIKLYDETKNIMYTIVGETENDAAYIGSDIAATTLSIKKKYFYKKGIFRFEKIKANKIYISFEQENFNDVTIKHAYWKAYETEALAKTNSTQNTWNGQERFSPYNVTIDLNQPQNIAWEKNSVVPYVEDPSRIKSQLEIIPIKIRYNRQSQKDVKRLKLTINNIDYYYLKYSTINSINCYVFVPKNDSSTFYEDSADFELNATMSAISADGRSSSLILIGTENTDISQYIESLKVQITQLVQSTSTYAIFQCSKNHGLSVGDKIYIDVKLNVNNFSISETIYTVTETPSTTQFKVSITNGPTSGTETASNSFFIKEVASPQLSNFMIETSKENANSIDKKDLFLTKNFEYLRAKRASIGIRDIFVGYETYSDAAEIVSKPFNIYGKLDLVNLDVQDYEPVEKDQDGNIIGRSKIRYYISVDGGFKWIEISPINRGFSGVPEILAFNQNLNSDVTLPQIAYYNSPEVPSEIKTVILKAVMKKERSVQATPIIYSYKLGLKVI